MIEYIRGALTALTPTSATLETGSGVAYLLNISLPTYSSLEGKADAKLYVHESIREDAWTLYGFTELIEREHFRALIGVSGVGAATAMLILSALQGPELAAVITSGDVKRLKAIKGIGAKTAERIIIDLRDKIKAADDTLLPQVTTAAAHSQAYDEALAALLMLGFEKKPLRKRFRLFSMPSPTSKSKLLSKKPSPCFKLRPVSPSCQWEKRLFYIYCAF